jgi:hypothetical protein
MLLSVHCTLCASGCGLWLLCVGTAAAAAAVQLAGLSLVPQALECDRRRGVFDSWEGRLHHNLRVDAEVNARLGRVRGNHKVVPTR